MTPEQAAEKYVQEQYAQAEAPYSNFELGQAWLAGHTFALTPRKIDPNDESAWPERGSEYLFFGGGMWFLSYIGKFIDKEFFTKNNYTHYIPIPPTPQGEG